jgi:NAD(P)H dehydrogenase (quinone)
VAGGMPRPAAEFFLTMFAASRAGEFDVVDPTLEAVIGRPATSVHEVLRAAVR